MEHVQCVLAKLQEAGLYLKLSKCKFNMQRISFVSFIITLEGVEMEPDRVRTIAEWPEPESHRDIQVFLGFVNFYRWFISAFSKIVKPMTDMLNGGEELEVYEPVRTHSGNEAVVPAAVRGVLGSTCASALRSS